MLQFKGSVPRNLVFQKAVKKPTPVRCVQLHEPFQVYTLEGIMQGNPGDWLLVGINGEMYPCEKEIFTQTYDLVAGDESGNKVS